MSAAGTSARWTGRRVASRERASIATELSRAAAVLAVLVLLEAVLSLTVDLATAPLLSEYLPTGPRADTASVMLVLSALSILLLRAAPGPVRRTLGVVTAGTAVVLGVFSLVQELAGPALPRRGASAAFDWIAPNTAVASILIGLGATALGIRSRQVQIVREPIALLAGLIGYLALLGYLYLITELYWLAGSNAMSLPTSLAVMALGTALVLARSDRGLGALLASEGLGGQMARRMLPAAVLIPTLLGLLHVAGERMHYYDSELGTALVIAATVILFGAAITWSATALDRVDAARRTSTLALREESRAHELERRRLTAVLDVLPVGVLIADANGRLIDVSPAARRIFGDVSRATPLSHYERIEGVDASTGAPLSSEQWALRRALRGETCLGQEVDIETFDGAKKTILVSAAAIRDERARIVGAVAISIDITERTRSERELAALKEELEEHVRHRTAELEAANAELEAFSYSVSHDLRAPLRWIDGFARALAEEHAAELGESGLGYLAELRDSVRRMRELIDSLLELARVTAQPLERRTVELGALAHEVARLIETEEPGRQVEWRITHGVTVDADPRLLRIVLDNLMRNAWKFTRERDPARIEVGTERVDGELAIYVRDDGVGFDSDHADKLFLPFERLHPAGEYEGTGIGLALVRRIVLRHGGRVWARSQPGRGATIWFTLTPRGSEP